MRSASHMISLGAIGLALVLGGLAAGPLQGEPLERDADQARADELVREALHGEIYGQAERRRSLLAEARQAAPDFAPAKWHSGLVKFRGQWTRADKVPLLLAQDPRYEAYLHCREKADDTPAAQFALASWCRNHNMKAEARAHLERVVQQAPNHAEARKRLGFRRVGRGWVHESEVEAIERLARERRDALSHWTPRLRRLAARLDRGDETNRSATLAEIRDLVDPQAIPAMESVLSRHSAAAATAVIDALAAMPGVESSHSLARHALLSPWPTVRRSAAQALKKRPMMDYVPIVLNSMRSPVVSASDISVAPNGSLLHRVYLQRQARGHNEVLVRDTHFSNARFRAQPTLAGGGDEVLRRMARFELAALAMANVENAQAFEWNQRAGALLGAVSQQPAHGDARQWWDWWSQEIERQEGDQKPTYVSYGFQTERVPTPGGQGGGQECLAAGTLVWTATGLVPIEKIQLGDLVLAQDPDSGELAYKPVLRTSVRPVTPLVRLTAGQDTFVSTGGHMFWVAGRGWVKARRLKSGHMLHGEQGPVPVRLVEPADSARTYNLVVADFPTFFVGEERILTHDFTEPRPTSAVVPGLDGVAR